ncbi:alpha/beta fold hydrolase [Govanella unica]|uniref:Alpha/beta fold hydrolase n=1 Tax=Govanella unica TaxID=2975056 RepID=A0A9X3TZJ7_9PROT|nr:alpha/beta fold hydrolase [Govania unica]MDA5194483.1 alpha/beta fold hydrolase [Govania unica]
MTGPVSGASRLLLAHGAGAPMDSRFMEAFAEGLGTRGVAVLRFEFPYMTARRETGNKRPPDRAPVLLECFRRAIADCGPAARLVIGGKSMGGRVASMLADEAGVAGLVCLGYPFQPPGKSDSNRTAHLKGLRTPGLIVQGTRDPFGGRAQVLGYDLAPSLELGWIEDGDHDLSPRKSSGRTETETWAQAMDMIAAFIIRI